MSALGAAVFSCVWPALLPVRRAAPEPSNFLRKCHEAVAMRHFSAGMGCSGIFVLQRPAPRGAFGRPPAGDNALLDIVTLLKQRCKPASTASLLQTHGSASSAVVGDACGKLTSTSARPVNPADALRRTPSRRHGVPVQCAGSTHRLDSRSLQDLTRSRPAGSAHANSSKKQH